MIVKVLKVSPLLCAISPGFCIIGLGKTGMGILTKIIDWVPAPYTIFLILRDPSVAKSAKLKAIGLLLLIFIYILLPFDIIPDAVPLAGWLDDLIVVPLAFTLAEKLIPIKIKERKELAESKVRRVVILTVIALIGAVLLGLLGLGVSIYLIGRLIAA